MKFGKATAEDLMKLEEKYKSILYPKLASKSFLLFEVINNDLICNRGYIFAKEAPRLLEQNFQVFKNPNLALWIDGTTTYVTEEFNELIKKDGFNFFKKHKDAFIYRKEDLICVIDVKRFDSITKRVSKHFFLKYTRGFQSRMNFYLDHSVVTCL